MIIRGVANTKLIQDQLLNVLEKTAGFLNHYPESIRKKYYGLADREGEEDREDSMIK